ncbi:sugar transporter [Fibrisoma montanum]|uniref:Sugar transporter n=1 Tax=Fibrisoma montanum TaxID=2305895 RepID=A0A418M8F3_9BACT|nr:SLBB domain-containing protein [Fibrisoma montanum]RIV22373.1 sugar transporter [Fibrisoma montanum]
MRTKDKLSHYHSVIRHLCFVLVVLLLAGVKETMAQRPATRVDQLSDEQVVEFYRRAQASGLSEEQIEQAAMSQGYTLDDITRMRRRITEIRSQANRGGGRAVVDTSIGRSLPGNLSRRTIDSLRLLRRDTTRRPVVFGASLFENANLSFEPNLRIATPRNYVVGPDDEITIDISGAASDNFRLKVSPEGAVKVPNVPPILVSGLTIEEAERRIIERLRKAGYQGLGTPGSGTYANVTLTNIRSIRVTLVGEVVRPGTYTISSLGTAFNALYLAGGPNPETGSFRRISIIRGNRVVRTIDLYDFILRGDRKDNIRLQDDDVIRVADYNTRVEMAGEVRRPAIFEVLPGETLKDILTFAGGFSDEAYRAAITLRRNTPRERRIINVTEDQIATFVPEPGDRYTIGKILNRYENRVQIVGAVMRPGDYALEPTMGTVRELIKRAEGLRNDAFLNRANIFRERNELERENLTFDLGLLMKGETQDIPLMRQDSIVIQSIRGLRENYYVLIQGAVNRPDTFNFINNMSVADLIALAGGFREGASSNNLEVARRIVSDSAGVSKNSVQTFQLVANRDLALSTSPDAQKNEANTFMLQPFDIVYVRSLPNYEAQREVYVYGEVKHPGNYAIASRNERIIDLIRRAGGIKPEAYLPGAQYRRGGELVGNDLRKIFDDPGAEENLLLKDGDTLFVPRRSEVIQIQGAVLNPSAVSYKSNFRFEDYIAQTGGFTDNARQKKAYVVYPNGRKDRTHRFLFIKIRPEVEPGSTIIVPFQPLDQTRLSATERIGIFSVITTLAATTATVLINLMNRQ